MFSTSLAFGPASNWPPRRLAASPLPLADGDGLADEAAIEVVVSDRKGDAPAPPGTELDP